MQPTSLNQEMTKNAIKNEIHVSRMTDSLHTKNSNKPELWWIIYFLLKNIFFYEINSLSKYTAPVHYSLKKNQNCLGCPMFKKTKF